MKEPGGNLSAPMGAPENDRTCIQDWAGDELKTELCWPKNENDANLPYDRRCMNTYRGDDLIGTVCSPERPDEAQD